VASSPDSVTTDTGYSDTITINPGGSGPTLTINRAELAAVLVAAVSGDVGQATFVGSPGRQLLVGLIT
jgi:hypothetical protein